jgi:hypothetical protein
MNVIANRFPGFAEHRIPAEGAELFVRTGGSGSKSRLNPRGASRWCLTMVHAGSD